jgi:serine/threonine protein phosphatase PrpC
VDAGGWAMILAPNKANQDCFLVCRNFMRDPNKALFSVFDGHGREGDACAQFARDLVRRLDGLGGPLDLAGWTHNEYL